MLAVSYAELYELTIFITGKLEGGTAGAPPVISALVDRFKAALQLEIAYCARCRTVFAGVHTHGDDGAAPGMTEQSDGVLFLPGAPSVAQLGPVQPSVAHAAPLYNAVAATCTKVAAAATSPVLQNRREFVPLLLDAAQRLLHLLGNAAWPDLSSPELSALRRAFAPDGRSLADPEILVVRQKRVPTSVLEQHMQRATPQHPGDFVALVKRVQLHARACAFGNWGNPGSMSRKALLESCSGDGAKRTILARAGTFYILLLVAFGRLEDDLEWCPDADIRALCDTLVSPDTQSELGIKVAHHLIPALLRLRDIFRFEFSPMLPEKTRESRGVAHTLNSADFAATDHYLSSLGAPYDTFPARSDAAWKQHPASARTTHPVPKAEARFPAPFDPQLFAASAALPRGLMTIEPQAAGEDDEIMPQPRLRAHAASRAPSASTSAPPPPPSRSLKRKRARAQPANARASASASVPTGADAGTAAAAHTVTRRPRTRGAKATDAGLGSGTAALLLAAARVVDSGLPSASGADMSAGGARGASSQAPRPIPVDDSDERWAIPDALRVERMLVGTGP